MILFHKLNKLIMAKEKTIKLTTKELLAELKPEFLKFFEQHILRKHGVGFTYSQEKGVFTAVRKKVETPKCTAELMQFITEGKFTEILLNDFLKKHFVVAGTPNQKSLQSRFLSISSYRSFEKHSLNDFFHIEPRDFFKYRGNGPNVYLEMCSEFRSMGFDISKYPLFKKEGYLKSGGLVRNMTD